MSKNSIRQYGTPANPRQNFHRISLYRTDHPLCDGFLYRGSGLTFQDDRDLQVFLNTCGGMIIPRSSNSYEVLCRKITAVITPTQEDYDRISDNETSVWHQGERRGKIVADNSGKSFTVYLNPKDSAV